MGFQSSNFACDTEDSSYAVKEKKHSTTFVQDGKADLIQDHYNRDGTTAMVPDTAGQRLGSTLSTEVYTGIDSQGARWGSVDGKLPGGNTEVRGILAKLT